MDGNKRTGLAASLAFLAMHDMEVNLDEGETVSLIVDVAAGRKDEHDLTEWLKENSTVSNVKL